MSMAYYSRQPDSNHVFMYVLGAGDITMTSAGTVREARDLGGF